jgi:hypothetical protein
LIADSFRKFHKSQTDPSYIFNILLHPLAVDFAPSENQFEADIKDWDYVALLVRGLYEGSAPNIILKEEKNLNENITNPLPSKKATSSTLLKESKHVPAMDIVNVRIKFYISP